MYGIIVLRDRAGVSGIYGTVIEYSLLPGALGEGNYTPGTGSSASMAAIRSGVPGRVAAASP